MGHPPIYSENVKYYPCQVEALVQILCCFAMASLFEKEHVGLTWVLKDYNVFFVLGLWTHLGVFDTNVNQPKVTLTK